MSQRNNSKKSFSIFLFGILFIAGIFLSGCERNIFNYAGKDAPKTQPEYTYSVEENRN